MTSATTPIAIHEQLEKALLANDAESLVRCYEHDAVWVPGSRGAPLSGTAAIREALSHLQRFRITGGGIKPTLKMERDGLALTSCEWHFRAVLPDGTPADFRGKGFEVMRRQADGSWLTHFDNPWNDVEVLQPDGTWVELLGDPCDMASLAEPMSA